jgi:hypothetical protein
MEYIPFFYFYFSWFLAGAGLSLLLLKLKRFFPLERRALFLAALVIGMLFVTLGVQVFWRFGIDALGGGFYAYPPGLAGMLAVFGWQRSYRAAWFFTLALNLAIGLFALSSYLGTMDCLVYSGGSLYDDLLNNETLALKTLAEIREARLDASLLYLAITIPAQIFLYALIPWTHRLLTKGRAAFSRVAGN